MLCTLQPMNKMYTKLMRTWQTKTQARMRRTKTFASSPNPNRRAYTSAYALNENIHQLAWLVCKRIIVKAYRYFDNLKVMGKSVGG